MTLRRILAGLIFLISLPLFAATEIIQMNYRMAEDVLPIAQSVVGEIGRAHV